MRDKKERMAMAGRILAHFTATVGSKLRLELPFSKLNKHLRSGPLLIRAPEGAHHNVEVLKQHHKIYLAAGWDLFEQEQGMEKGDILFCKLFECKMLWVRVIEKKRMPSTNLPKAKEKKRNYLYANSFEDLDEEGKGSRRIKERAQHEIEETVEAARKRLSDRYHIMKFTRWKLQGGRCSLPKPFAANISVKNGGIVNVVVPGCKQKQIIWGCSYSRSQASFGAGWSDFCLLHRIKEDDWALLEVTSQNAITIHIYHSNNPSTLAPFYEELEKRFSDSAKTCHKTEYNSKTIRLRNSD